MSSVLQFTESCFLIHKIRIIILILYRNAKRMKCFVKYWIHAHWLMIRSVIEEE